MVSVVNLKVKMWSSADKPRAGWVSEEMFWQHAITAALSSDECVWAEKVTISKRMLIFTCACENAASVTEHSTSAQDSHACSSCLWGEVVMTTCVAQINVVVLGATFLA